MKKFLFLFIALWLTNCTKQNDLDAMNNVEMPDFEQIDHFVKSTDTIKILIVGNSITSHEKAISIGWKYKAGMAASSIENDYVHLLFKNLIKHHSNQNIIVRYLNYSEFERNPSEININSKKFKSCYNFNPSFLIFQLGDNVNHENSQVFFNKSLSFIENFPNTQKIILSPFISTPKNREVNKILALRSHSTFVDISLISNNDFYKAISTPNKDWKADGIKLHPNDLGMSFINEKIFNSIIKTELH